MGNESEQAPDDQKPADRASHMPDQALTKQKANDTIESSSETESKESAEGGASGGSKFKHLCEWYKDHKKLSIPLTIVLVLGALFAIPFTRYALAGTVLKHDLTATILDAQTNKPVTSATVTLAGKSVQTNNKGQAVLRVPVGSHQAMVVKKYYATTQKDVFVPLLKSTTATITVTATGRQVPISVVNKITNQPVANITLKAADTQVKTDKDGKAVLVLPADKKTVSAALSGMGYNNLTSQVTVTATEVAANTFAVVPSGKLYFLSNASGKIDVVKTDLDGSNRQTVYGGTGNEDSANTTLLASRDWKYLALLSKHDGGDKAKLFLVDTSNDAVTTMDEGNADFTLAGWSGKRFVYTVSRSSYKDSQPKKNVIKSFDAVSRKITTLSESDAQGDDTAGYSYQTFSTPYIIGNDANGKVIYTARWYVGTGDYNTAANITKSKTLDIVTAAVDGSAKKTVRSFPSIGNDGYFRDLESRVYAPNEVYFKLGDSQFYEYEDGQVKDVSNINRDKFYSTYPTYLASPAEDKTFWSEARDGKNTLFVGDADGKNGKTVASLSEYSPYGWYAGDYLLASKKGSELYIMPSKPEGTIKPVKLSDYYKPVTSYVGYGSGYGGL